MSDDSLSRESVVDSIRTSCKAVAISDKSSVKINLGAVQRFSAELRTVPASQLALGCEEPSSAGLSCVCAKFGFAALSFGGGYRVALLRHCARGAAQTISFGIPRLFRRHP
eukprot:RCo009271